MSAEVGRVAVAVIQAVILAVIQAVILTVILAARLAVAVSQARDASLVAETAQGRLQAAQWE